MQNNYIAINNTRISWIDTNKILRSIKYYVYAPKTSYAVSSLNYDRFDNIENCNSVLATYDLNIALLSMGEIIIVSKKDNTLPKSILNIIGFVSLMCLSKDYLCLLNNENILYILNVNNLSNIIIQINDVISVQAHCNFNYIVFRIQSFWYVYTKDTILQLPHAYTAICMQTNDLICTTPDNLVWHVYWDDDVHTYLLDIDIKITKVCSYGIHSIFIDSMNKLNSVMISKCNDSGIDSILTFGSTYKNSTECMTLDESTNAPKFIDGFDIYLDCVDGSQIKNLQYLDIDRVIFENCWNYMVIKYKMQYKIYKFSIYSDSIYLPEDFTLYEGGDDGTYI